MDQSLEPDGNKDGSLYANNKYTVTKGTRYFHLLPLLLTLWYKRRQYPGKRRGLQLVCAFVKSRHFLFSMNTRSSAWKQDSPYFIKGTVIYSCLHAPEHVGETHFTSRKTPQGKLPWHTKDEGGLQDMSCSPAPPPPVKDECLGALQVGGGSRSERGKENWEWLWV